MPVAQLVGYREFYSLRFRVTEDTLIPRPETEHLVLEALDRARSISDGGGSPRIADIGTGSGAIAGTLAKHLPNALITAVDLCPAALRVAEWNAQQHDVEDRIVFAQSDLLDAIDSPSQFDLICSNPPYISEEEYRQLSPTVRDYEPIGALVAGPNGTEVIERVLRQTCERLRSGGHLILELSPMIADSCLALVEDVGVFKDSRFIKDLDGHRRILSLIRR